MNKIKKGDKVKIISGKDKGVEALVEKVFPREDLILVEGVNQVKRHMKATKTNKGGIITINKPINVSNVMLICPKCSKPVRVGFILVDGKKHRVCKKCKEII